MSEQNFAMSEHLEEVLNRMHAVQVELDNLKQKVTFLPQVEPTPIKQPTILNSTRRKTLKRLGFALLGGAAAATISGFSVSEAKMVVNPASGGGKIGTLVAPPGEPVPTNAPLASMGLVSTDGVALNLSLLPSDVGGYNAAVLGYSGTSTGNGIVGLVSGTNSYGVYGYATNNGSVAVFGTTNGTLSEGVHGEVVGENSNGVYGAASAKNSNAVIGYSSYLSKDNSYAGYFAGDVHLSGTLTGGTKSFKIDHPLDPAGKYLYHTSVESPDMKNIYDGVVILDSQGAATVEMPEWFEALNSDFRYQLTSLGAASPNLHIAEEIQERSFKIAGGLAGQKVSWMVTGIRQDAYAKAHRSPVEKDKTGAEKGKYIHPELFGQPAEMSASPRPKAAKYV